MMRNLLISMCVLMSLGTGSGMAQSGAGATSSDQDLSGEWDVTIMPTNWKVKFVRDKAKEKPGDDPMYCGKATRKGDDGEDVTLEICGFRTKDNKLRFLTGYGALANDLKSPMITCEAPFTATGTMSGRCVIGDTSMSGTFAAIRVSPKQPAPSTSPSAQEPSRSLSDSSGVDLSGSWEINGERRELKLDKDKAPGGYPKYCSRSATQQVCAWVDKVNEFRVVTSIDAGTLVPTLFCSARYESAALEMKGSCEFGNPTFGGNTQRTPRGLIAKRLTKQ